jgi:hypothetical protein
MYETEIDRALSGETVFIQVRIMDMNRIRINVNREIIARTKEPIEVRTQIRQLDSETGLILKRFVA